jgi:hypothetical protein
MSCPVLSSHGHVSNVSGGWFRSHASDIATATDQPSACCESHKYFTLVLLHCSSGCFASLTDALFYCTDWTVISPATHRGGPSSRPGHSAWDFWWTNWHQDNFFPSSSPFSCQYKSAVFPILVLGGRDHKLSLACRHEQQHSVGSVAARSEA